MRKKFIGIIMLCLIILFTGFDNQETIISKANIGFTKALKRQLNMQLKEQLKTSFTKFEVNLIFKSSKKIYVLYSSDYNHKIQRLSNNIKHINYINLDEVKQLDDGSVRVNTKGEGLEISNISASINCVGLYDKDTDSYLVAGKVLNISGRQFTKVEMRLLNGSMLSSDLSNGCFIFKFKSSNKMDKKKNMTTYGEEVDYIKAIDSKGHEDTYNFRL